MEKVVKTVWTIEPFTSTIFVTTKTGEEKFTNQNIESEVIKVDFKKSSAVKFRYDAIGIVLNDKKAFKIEYFRGFFDEGKFQKGIVRVITSTLPKPKAYN